MRANAQIHHTHLTRVAAELSPRLLRQRLTRGNEIITLASASGRDGRVRNYLDQRAQRLRSAWQLLNAYSYRKVLERGFASFAMVRDTRCGRLPRWAAACGSISSFRWPVGATVRRRTDDTAGRRVKAANARRRARFRRAGQSFRLLIVAEGFACAAKRLCWPTSPAMGGRICSIAMIDPRR